NRPRAISPSPLRPAQDRHLLSRECAASFEIYRCENVRPALHRTTTAAHVDRKARKPDKYCAVAIVIPLSPCTGSIKMAIVDLVIASRMAARSLKGTCLNPATGGSNPFLIF